MTDDTATAESNPDRTTLDDLRAAIETRDHDHLETVAEEFLNDNYDLADWSVSMEKHVHLEFENPEEPNGEPILHVVWMYHEPEPEDDWYGLAKPATGTVVYETEDGWYWNESLCLTPCDDLWTEIQGRHGPEGAKADQAKQALREFISRSD